MKGLEIRKYLPGFKLAEQSSVSSARPKQLLIPPYFASETGTHCLVRVRVPSLQGFSQERVHQLQCVQ